MCRPHISHANAVGGTMNENVLSSFERNYSNQCYTQFVVLCLCSALSRLIRRSVTRGPAPSYARLAWWIMWRQYLRHDVILSDRLLQSIPSRRPQFSFQVRRDTKQTRQTGLGVTSAFVGFNFVCVIKPCVPSRPTACLLTHGYCAHRNRVTSSSSFGGSQFRWDLILK